MMLHRHGPLQRGPLARGVPLAPQAGGARPLAIHYQNKSYQRLFSLVFIYKTI